MDSDDGFVGESNLKRLDVKATKEDLILKGVLKRERETRERVDSMGGARGKGGPGATICSSLSLSLRNVSTLVCYMLFSNIFPNL